MTWWKTAFADGGQPGQRRGLVPARPHLYAAANYAEAAMRVEQVVRLLPDRTAGLLSLADAITMRDSRRVGPARWSCWKRRCNWIEQCDGDVAAG